MKNDIIEQRAESREQRAESREQRAESREQRAESREQRAYYFDFLRVFATFAVIVLHVAAQNWYRTSVSTFAWQIFNFYHGGISRWAVPIFVMISGALFLNKNISFKKIFSKYVFRIVVAFLFWSLVYAVPPYITNRNIIKTLGNFISGRYHLWFLFMITGLYIILPFTKKIANSEFLTKYFLLLAFIFTFLLPQCIDFISAFSGKYGTFAKGIFNKFNMNFVMGFTAYFLLGYVLNRIDVPSKFERIIYVVGFLGFFATVLMSGMVSIIKNEPDATFYDNMTVNVLFESVAVFVFFKKHLSKPSKLILILSKYSFGAYLVHDAVIKVVQLYGLTPVSFNPIFSIPTIAIIVFLFSFTISGVLNQIPVLKKYIV